LARENHGILANISDADLENNLLAAAHPERADETRNHVHEHIVRLRLLFDSVGRANGKQALLDVGGTGNMLPIYIDQLGYSHVSMANKWRSLSLDAEHLAKFVATDKYHCDYFDAEVERFPYDDGIFDTVVCSEVIEHLKQDPAHMIAEINRVLKPGGRLILTTPNITSVFALYRLLSGAHPQVWSVYTGKDGDRHNREYTPAEIRKLLQWAGFSDVDLKTFSLGKIPFKLKLISSWIFLPWTLRGQAAMAQLRGEYIMAVCVKEKSARADYPEWLYG
jgi:2-polyprenyl-3-methyl-5-hydroxy-6-metoxy-1,4-benzoquinol methylase